MSACGAYWQTKIVRSCRAKTKLDNLKVLIQLFGLEL